MRTLLHLFYRLPMTLILLLASAATIVFLEIRKRFCARPWFRWGCGGLLVLWVYVLLYLTVLHRTPGSCTEWYVIPLRFLWEMHVTGNTELVRTMFMNAALFYPPGLLMAALLPRKRALPIICCTAFAVSAAVEVTQFLMAFGRAEMDDVFFNTLGAFLGALSIHLHAKS